MSNSPQATFTLNFDSNGKDVGEEVARELETLRQKAAQSQDAIKQFGSSLRSLRGSSDQVKAAREQLTAKLNAEKDAFSRANLEILKQGVTYDKLTTAAKKLEAQKKELDDKLKAKALEEAEDRTKAMGNAVKVAGGPVESLAGRFEALKGVLGGSGGAMGAVVLGAAAAAAAIAALTAAVIAGTVALLRWIVVAADSQRSLALTREAFTGSAASAKGLGEQVDALASKVPKSKAELTELGNQLARTRLSGGAIVDTFNLVGQASSAMGDDVGRTLQDIVTRGQMWNRFQLNPLELQGTGLKFQDIAGELAKQMNVGVKDAQQALIEGRVKLDDGAKAMRAAVEKRFGEINAKKLLSLDAQAQRLKDNLASLTSNVNLEPFLKGLAELGSLFDDSTVAGAELKKVVTIIGDQIGPAFQSAVPIAKGLIKVLIIAALQLVVVFLQVRNAVKKAFGGDTLNGFVTLDDAINLARGSVYVLVGAFAALGVAVAVATAPIWVSALALYGLYKAGAWVWDKLSSIEWGKLGGSIIDGIVSGLRNGVTAVGNAVTDIAKEVKQSFADTLGIHSPSRVFRGMMLGGVVGGIVGGARAGTPGVQDSMRELAAGGAEAYAGESAGAFPGPQPLPLPPPTAARAAAPAAGPVELHLHLHGLGEDAAKKIQQPSILAMVTKALEDALTGAGIPTSGVTT